MRANQYLPGLIPSLEGPWRTWVAGCPKAGSRTFGRRRDIIWNTVMLKLIEGARKLGLNLTPDQVTLFRRYRQELLAWQSRANLTAITDDEGIQTKHFVDSLSCLVA